MLCQHLAIYLLSSFLPIDSPFVIRDRHKMDIETLLRHFAIKWLSVQFTQLFSSTVMLKLKYE